MAYVPGLYFKNLPFGIDDGSLREALLEDFPGVFNPETLKTTVYDQRVEGTEEFRQVGVARGLQVNIQELQRKARGKRIHGFSLRWFILPDYGTERDANGRPAAKMSPDDFRASVFEQGQFRKKPMAIFQQDFLAKVNPRVFTGGHEAFIKTSYYARDELSRAGIVGHIKPFQGGLNVKYNSSLEALQAIMLLNTRRSLFCNKAFDETAPHIFGHGLGREGDILDVDERMLTMGYVPFSEILDGVFDLDKIDQIKSQCFKCKEAFSFLGIDSNLSYLTGVCKCTYDSCLDVGAKERAIFWYQEKFTRLFLGTRDTQSEIDEETQAFEAEWKIMHQPLSRYYADAKEYRMILSPILAHEFKTETLRFKALHSCDARLEAFQFIENIAIDGKDNDVYSLSLSLPKTRFWNDKKRFAIGGLTLEFNIENRRGGIERIKRKTAISELTENGDQVTVMVKINLCEGDAPQRGSTVAVTPKPIKTHYRYIRHVLSQFEKDPVKFAHLYTIINSENNLHFPESHQEKQKRVHGTTRLTLNSLRAGLNKEQMDAVIKAKINPISVIQGPPGCGKTMVSSTLIPILLVHEKGHVLGCAPSNLAADNLASACAERIDSSEFCFKVLRVLSKKREDLWVQHGRQNELHPSVSFLHEEVRNSPMWLAGDQFNTVRNRIQRNERHLLTKAEEDLLKSHVRSIERQIMDGYDVIVSTAGVLTDHRISSWNRGEKITTVICDEAAQLTQVDTLPLLMFGQDRTVLVGDHLQLKTILVAFSAQISLLGLSAMDWFRKAGNKIPWTMLKEQHRMHSDIRQLVSSLTYDGLLIDSAGVKNRVSSVDAILASGFKTPLSSRVVLIKHTYKENRAGTSIFNKGEGEITKRVCERFLHLKTNPANLTVLCLYDAQKNFLENKIGGLNISVKTVDSFQGCENQIIILNMCRSGYRQIGFAAKPDRLNVALSRARELLVVVCDLSTFSLHKSKAIQDFIRLVGEVGDIRGVESIV